MDINTTQFLNDCREIWREENAASFGGKLRRVPYFGLCKNKKIWAYHTLSRKNFDCIFVQSDLRDKPLKLRKILIHEMIHQEQAQHKSKWVRKEWHGRFFKRRVLEILLTRGIYIPTEFS